MSSKLSWEKPELIRLEALSSGVEHGCFSGSGDVYGSCKLGLFAGAACHNGSFPASVCNDGGAPKHK